MTVVNPKSISGITSITTASGSDNLLTIHTNNGTERLRVDSTGTTKIVTGIVTTLTATTGIVTTLTASTVTSLGDVDIADKIVHTGDTDTAIRFSAADTVSVETGGTQKLSLGSATVFNETGADVDFRIESSGTANMFLLDAGNNRIGLNRPTPLEMFEVGGNIFLSSNTSNANEGNALKFQSKTGGFDTSYGAAIHGLRVGDASSYLRFDTGGQSEKMRLDSNGYLGLHITDPHLYYSKTLVVGAETEGDGGGITIKGSSSHTNYLMFADSNSGAARYDGYVGYSHGNQKLYLATAGGSRADIDSSGNLSITNGNLVIATSGKGIDFSATGGPTNGASTSELFDDYERGTYNASVTIGSGTITNTFANTLNYTKIGRVVHVIGRLYTAHSQTDVTTYQFTLPYACTGGGDAVESGGALKVFRANEISGEHPAGFRAYRIESGNAYAKLASNNSMNGGNFGTTNPHIIVNCTYHAAA